MCWALNGGQGLTGEALSAEEPHESKSSLAGRVSEGGWQKVKLGRLAACNRIWILNANALTHRF